MKTVIFDMDGVIFDSERIVKMCWEAVSDKYHLYDIDETYYKSVGTNKAATRVILNEKYGADFDVTSFFEDTRTKFYEYTEKYGMPKKDGAEELLAYLKKKEYRIGLASSTRYAAVVEELRDTGLLGYFDYIIGGDMVEHSKPNPEIFEKCLAGLGGRASDTYVIEDSYNGIRAAKAAGMIPVMVPDMLEPDEEMREKARFIKKNLYEVMDIL